MTTRSRAHIHSMRRIDVHTGTPFAEFRAAFEKLLRRSTTNQCDGS